MERIQIIGADILDESEKRTVDKLSNEYYEKFERTFQNETSLVVHIKESKTEGKKKLFTVNARAVAPTRTITGSAEDWDLARTLHKVFKDIENQLEHMFK